jgi:hypothetical protein
MDGAQLAINFAGEFAARAQHAERTSIERQRAR